MLWYLVMSISTWEKKEESILLPCTVLCVLYGNLDTLQIEVLFQRGIYHLLTISETYTVDDRQSCPERFQRLTCSVAVEEGKTENTLLCKGQMSCKRWVWILCNQQWLTPEYRRMELNQWRDRQQEWCQHVNSRKELKSAMMAKMRQCVRVPPPEYLD